MRGHIVKRYENSYSIVIDEGRDPATGKRRQHWESIKGSRKDAEKRRTELLRQLDTGNYTKPGKATVAAYLSAWMQDYCKPNLSPRGFERYQGIVTKYFIPAFGAVALTQLKPGHIQQHYTARLDAGLSARTIRYHHAVIHKALQTALKRGLVSRNVADSVDVPRIHRAEMTVWNEDEVNTFLDAARSTEYYALFYLALYTGMRRSELLALRWQDIDFLYGQIYVTRSLHHLKDGSYVFTEPKSARSRRTIALPPSAFLTLKDYRDQQDGQRLALGMPALTDVDLVFSHWDGKPLRPNTVTYAWARLCVRCGVKVIRLHDARHTHASLMLKQGIHPKVVQERLGHSSISMTLDTYSHVAPGIQEAAAASFDKLLNRKPESVERTV